MEIRVDLPIDPAQTTLLEMHSALNVLNVVQYELIRLSDYLNNPKVLEDLCEATVEGARELADPSKAKDRVRNIHAFIDTVNACLNEVEQDIKQDEFTRAVRNNLAGIFSILKIRSQELVERWESDNAWVDFEIKKLKNNFKDVLNAIEKNSHGAYHIVYNFAEYDEGDYFINLAIDSPNGKTIKMPDELQDVMRDLLANSRKYTNPGGTILAGLEETKDHLIFAVRDNGRGIPTDEIESVVQFGKRATNAKDKPTRGGGFGLTKAYYVTKMFNGKMFIHSPVEAGKGTEVRLEIPLP
jgi:signal transduction histidine kinase